MRCYWMLIAAVVAAPHGAFAQPPRVTCTEFVAMTPDSQVTFVSGAMTGVGVTFGVTDAFAQQFAGASPAEHSAVERMRTFPKRFLAQGGLSDIASITDKTRAICQASPNMLVGNALANALSGTKP